MVWHTHKGKFVIPVKCFNCAFQEEEKRGATVFKMKTIGENPSSSTQGVTGHMVPTSEGDYPLQIKEKMPLKKCWNM